MNPTWVLIGALVATDFGLCIQLFRMTKELRLSTEAFVMLKLHATAAITFANAMADRGMTIRCDDCGNMMGPDDSISVIPRPDGDGFYVGHHSHNRHQDWGYRVE